MRLANLNLAAALVLSAGLWAVGQAPPDEPGDHRPPPPHDRMQDMPDDHDGGDRDRDRDRDDRRKGWWGQDKEMNEAEVREAIQVLRRIDPGKAEKLERAVNENPQELGKVLREHAPFLGRFMAWRKFDPTGFDLRIRDMELSRQARECAERLREALNAEDDAIAATERVLLEELVADHFDIRQQIRQHELDMLKNRIEELVEQLDERAQQKAELIQQRVDELIKDKSDDRW